MKMNVDENAQTYGVIFLIATTTTTCPASKLLFAVIVKLNGNARNVHCVPETTFWSMKFAVNVHVQYNAHAIRTHYWYN